MTDACERSNGVTSLRRGIIIIIIMIIMNNMMNRIFGILVKSESENLNNTAVVETLNSE